MQCRWQGQDACERSCPLSCRCLPVQKSGDELMSVSLELCRFRNVLSFYCLLESIALERLYNWKNSKRTFTRIVSVLFVPTCR